MMNTTHLSTCFLAGSAWIYSFSSHLYAAEEKAGQKEYNLESLSQLIQRVDADKEGFYDTTHIIQKLGRGYVDLSKRELTTLAESASTERSKQIYQAIQRQLSNQRQAWKNPGAMALPQREVAEREDLLPPQKPKSVQASSIPGTPETERAYEREAVYSPHSEASVLYMPHGDGTDRHKKWKAMLGRGKTDEQLKEEEKERKKFNRGQLPYYKGVEQRVIVGIDYSEFGGGSTQPRIGVDFYFRDLFMGKKNPPVIGDGRSFKSWPMEGWLGVTYGVNLGEEDAPPTGGMPPGPNDFKLDNVNSLTVYGGLFKPLIKNNFWGISSQKEYDLAVGPIVEFATSYFPEADGSSNETRFSAGLRLAAYEHFQNNQGQGPDRAAPRHFIDIMYTEYDGTLRDDAWQVRGMYRLFNTDTYAFVQGDLTEGKDDEKAIIFGIHREIPMDKFFDNSGGSFFSSLFSNPDQGEGTP